MDLLKLINSSSTYIYCSNLVSNHNLVTLIRLISQFTKKTMRIIFISSRFNTYKILKNRILNFAKQVPTIAPSSRRLLPGAVSRRRNAEPSSSAGSMAPVPTRHCKVSPFPSRSRPSHISCPPGCARGGGVAVDWRPRPRPFQLHHTLSTHMLPTRPPPLGTCQSARQRTERSRPHPCRGDSAWKWESRTGSN